MKLWGGRFTKETDQLVNNFNASISFDQKFFRQDIRGSIAHAYMLGNQGIITKEESKQIQDGLKGILSDIENGKLALEAIVTPKTQAEITKLENAVFTQQKAISDAQTTYNTYATKLSAQQTHRQRSDRIPRQSRQMVLYLHPDRSR